jgi:hypothetical protein
MYQLLMSCGSLHISLCICENKTVNCYKFKTILNYYQFIDSANEVWEDAIGSKTILDDFESGQSSQETMSWSWKCLFKQIYKQQRIKFKIKKAYCLNKTLKDQKNYYNLS